MLTTHRVSSIVRQQRLNAECAECILLGVAFIVILFLMPGQW